MNPFKEEFIKLKTELIALGEDPDELSFWENFLELMSDEEKLDLLFNLKNEAEELKRSSR